METVETLFEEKKTTLRTCLEIRKDKVKKDTHLLSIAPTMPLQPHQKIVLKKEKRTIRKHRKDK